MTTGLGTEPPTTSATLRSARPTEIDEVIELWRRADEPPSVTDDVEAVAELLSVDPDAVIVADVGGQLVGAVLATWDGWRGSLYRLAVLPRHRRRGIGRQLVEAALDQLRGRGARRISALVLADDSTGVAFWESLGDLGVQRDPAPRHRYLLTAGRADSRRARGAGPQ